MIDISSIISETVDENLKNFIKELKTEESGKDTLDSEAHVYRGLMNYSSLLLKKYHESLKKTLSSQGIDI